MWEEGRDKERFFFGRDKERFVLFTKLLLSGVCGQGRIK